MCPLADDSQRIMPLINKPLGVLVSAVEDEVVPLIYVMPQQLTYFGIVQDGASLSQAEHHRFNRRTDQFVNAGLVFLLLHGRLVAVDVRMASVVVEHDAWFWHGLAYTSCLEMDQDL